MIRLTTSRSEQPGRLFLGVVKKNGDLHAIDAADGRKWTSRFGPASPKHLKLAVFTETPVAGQPDPPMQVVELFR